MAVRVCPKGGLFVQKRRIGCETDLCDEERVFEALSPSDNILDAHNFTNQIASHVWTVLPKALPGALGFLVIEFLKGDVTQGMRALTHTDRLRHVGGFVCYVEGEKRKQLRVLISVWFPPRFDREAVT
jgi:hypothetical protein